MRLPFGDVGPVPLLLGFVEVGIEAHNELSQETLSQVAGCLLFFIEPPLKFEVLSLCDVSADLC